MSKKMELQSTDGKVKVLIIEDNDFSSELLCQIVTATYVRFSAKTGADGLRIYEQQSPDIVFLDLRLPDIDGLKVLERIKQINKDAYVVIISGNSTKENVGKATELNVKGFLGKPFARGKILEHINAVERQIKSDLNNHKL